MIQTPIAIVGMGKSGESARRFLLAQGYKNEDLLTFDEKAPAQFKNSRDLIEQGQPKSLVVSPGVPLKTPWIVAAEKSGLFITSEINLACSILKSEKIIGVTGSLGKSTTVSLLGQGLAAFDKNAFVGGNLGTPFCDYAFEVSTGKRPRASWIVLELSSYQLENCRDLQLDCAAITYLSPNHMERYDSLSEYYLTKWRIIDKTRGPLFINKNGGDLEAFAQKQPEFSRALAVSKNDKDLIPHVLSQSLLLGSHNQDNIALAAQIALRCHWPISSIQAMKTFSGLEHRLENVGVFDGIRYINDSKATAMDSVLSAVQVAQEYLSAQGTLFVLLGGKDKNLPWEKLGSLVQKPQIKFLFFGACRDLAQKKSGLPGASFEKLSFAMNDVFEQVQKNDIVLLSPGGTSFDEFTGFEDRGRFFKDLVKKHSVSKN